MRESLSKSLYSHDLQMEEWESAIDRIAALRASTRLGSALFRWRYGLDRASRGKAYLLALRLASRRLKVAPHHPDFGILKLAVKQALTEWHSPLCRACQGVGEIKPDKQDAGRRRNEQTRLICQRCEGTGAHRYSDRERARTLGVDKLGKWTERINEILHMINAKEIGVVVGARRELER